MTDLRLHAPAVAGTVGLLLAALLVLVLQPRWQREADAARQLAQQQVSRALAARPPAPAAATQLPVLPVAGLLPQRQSALAALAQRHGIALDSLRLAAPQPLGSGAAPLVAERVPLRLSGTAPYLAWRRFVAEALQQDDALLLEQLQLGRGSAGSTALAGELQWALLQQADGRGADGATARPAAARAAR